MLQSNASVSVVTLELMLVLGSQACSSTSPSPSGDSGGVFDGPMAGLDGSPMSCGNIVGQGYAVGQIAQNWTLKDRNGNNVNLYDYCGNVIYFEDGAEW